MVAVLPTNTPGSYCTVAARKMQRAVQLEISSEIYCFVCVVKIVTSSSLNMNNTIQQLLKNDMNVNDSRKYLFTRKGRSLENLPPRHTHADTKRAIYWSNCYSVLFPQQELPNPADWAWKKGSTGWEPLWTT